MNEKHIPNRQPHIMSIFSSMLCMKVLIGNSHSVYSKNLTFKGGELFVFVVEPEGGAAKVSFVTSQLGDPFMEEA